MSELERKLAGDGLVITGELPGVDGGGLDAVRERLEQYEPWVDAMNATDNTAAHAHASNVAIAIALKLFGVEPIMQVVCRDKNRLAIQADIVGAAMHGVENICCLTGDDVTAGDEKEARRVFDLDGPQVIVTAAAIARGEYLSAARSSPRRTSSSAPSRTPARRRSTTASSARSRRRAPARASCSCRSATSPPTSRRSAPSGRASASSSAPRCCPRSASSPGRGRSSSWTRRCRASWFRRR